MNKYDTYTKAIKVLKSCETEGQRLIAIKYICRVQKLFPPIKDKYCFTGERIDDIWWKLEYLKRSVNAGMVERYTQST